MYCAVLLLADGTYDREFIDYLPTSQDIRDLEDDHRVYVHLPCNDYVPERRPAKLINLFKIGELGDE